MQDLRGLKKKKEKSEVDEMQEHLTYSLLLTVACSVSVHYDLSHPACL